MKVSRVSRNLIDAAATAVGEIDVVVTVMVLHELSFDASELATADATTAVLPHFGRVQPEQRFVTWQRLCQCPDCPMITTVTA